jgi:hypothetical protein
VQATPSSNIPLGPGLDDPLATKPIVFVAPGANAGSQLGELATTEVVSWNTVAFHPLTMVTPLGKVKLTTHGVSVNVPVLVTETEPI